MTQQSITQQTTTPEARARALLDAALPHVPFDGWSEATFRAALADSDLPEGLARAMFPRGGLDLAIAYHRRGDAAMTERLATTPPGPLRYSEKVAHAVRTRLDVVEDKELVRRGSTLFALPQNAAEGAKLIWGTADAIWTALGDTSTDLNWYSKRATLSAVYGATVLFWLGDDSPGHAATWDFLDRRIENVMQIEKAKARLRENPLAKALQSGPFAPVVNAMAKFRMPQRPQDLPGRSN